MKCNLTKTLVRQSWVFFFQEKVLTFLKARSQRKMVTLRILAIPFYHFLLLERK